MTDVAVGFLVCLMAMAAIGFGPSLWLLIGKDRFGVAFAICPVVGLVVISVFGTSLTVLGWPVSHWAGPALIVGIVISIVLTLLSSSRDPSALTVARRQLVVPLAVYGCSGMLIIMPQLVGGLQYSILRGNGTDSFNYLIGAGALDHESLSWMSGTDAQALVDQHPAYLWAHYLLKGRWTTMMLLAFSSRIVGIDPYRFEYAFSALCLLLAFGPVFLWCNRLIDVPPLFSALAAAAVSVGFWGQFVLDERAVAHQNVIPTLLLLGFLVARIEMLECDRMRWGEHILLGLTAAALLLIYPEIAPMTLLGLAAFLGIRMLKTRLSGVRLAGWTFSVCLAAIAVLPMLTRLVGFLAQQLNYASAGANTWHLAYFPWLYSSPLTGLWGFGPLVAGEASGAYACRLVLLPLSGLLTIALGTAVARAASVAAKYPGLALSSTLAAAAFVQWGYFYSRGQLWAGAKGLSYGYPFLIISVVGYGLSHAPPNLNRWRAHWKTGVAICVTMFLLIQGFLAVYRPWLAMYGVDYVGYIFGHGEYRRHDWDLAPFERVLKPQRGLTVWSDVSNPWVAEYIGLVLGWDVHLVNVGASRNLANAPPQHRDRPPDYLIVESAAALGWSRRDRRGVVATTHDLSLLKIDNTPTLISIENPNGFEGSPDAPFFWLGDQPSILKVVTASEGCALLRARFSPGPSRPDLPDRHLTLATTVDPDRDSVLIKGGPQDIQFRTTAGLNQIQLHVEEAATFLLPSDKRPLLLRVDELRLDRVPCRIGGQ